MTCLIDTHTLIWFLSGDSRLSNTARALIEDENNEVLVSIASLWEMAIKFSLGRLIMPIPFELMFPEELEKNDIAILGITVNDLHAVSKLPFHHRDPFDRLIVAQAASNNAVLIGVDAALDKYGINRMW